MMRPVLPLIGLICCSLSLFAQDKTDYQKGLLWEISGNGLSRPGYLYGTMHVPEKLAFNLSDSFFLTLRQVDMVALETDHDQWQAFTQELQGHESDIFMPSSGFDFSGIRRSTQADLYGERFVFPLPDNELLGAMLSARPRMTNEFLYRSNQFRQDYEEDTYLDLFIFQAGKKLGKKVIGLETLEGSYEAFVRAQIPDDDPDNDQAYHSRNNGPRMSLEEAYRDQNLTMIDSINRMAQPSKNFKRWMQDERNLVMLHRMDSILQSGTTLFTAVGAAHLPGDMGLIRLLSEKGYKLRPVQFSAESSKKEMDRIENLRYPVQLGTQWAPDSAWSVVAPGPFFQTIEVPGLEQQLCADMSNGAYYAVYRLHSYGIWNGQTPDYIAGRVDSLIYEKIPGKIQERIRLDSPFPGHEVTTRTRRGDIMRFKIQVTPMDVYLFVTGGNGDYALGEEGSRFIKSIHLKEWIPDPGGPVSIAPPQGGFKAEFPVAPFLNTTSDKKADRFLIAGMNPADSAFYLLYRTDFQDWGYIEEDSFELNLIGEKIAGQFTKSPPERRLLSNSPFPMQDLSFRSDRDSAWYFLRLVIDGPHYYLLGCRKPAPGAPTAYFDAFRIEPVKYPGGFETFTDTTLLFKADIPVLSQPPSLHPFLQKLLHIVKEGYRKQKDDDVYGGYFSRTKSRNLSLPLSGEELNIISIDMSATGWSITQDSFENLIRKRVSNDGRMILREQEWKIKSDRLWAGSFLAADTNSTRGIRSRVIVTPGRQYVLSTTVNLEAPESDFVRSLFDSFTPADTTPGALAFGRRNMDFLQNIYAPDTLVRAKALGELNSSWTRRYEVSDFQAIRAALEHPGFSRLKFTYRNSLIRALGQSQAPEARQWLLNFMEKYPDSMRYRQAARVALARMRTQASFEHLTLDLLHNKMFMESSAISEIADIWEDTLPLSARQFPELLNLIDQPDWAEPLFRVLYQLVQKGLISPKKYARLKPRLIQDVALALSRMRYNRELKQENSSGTNNYYNGYAYIPDNRQQDLSQKLRLLAPFWAKDNSVKALFEEAIRQDDKVIRIQALCLMQQAGIPVKPETLRPYADDDQTRFELYCRLADAGRLEGFRPWFADSAALARSILWSQNRETLDSVIFKSRHRTLRNGSAATLYFFEVKMKKDPEWHLAYVLVSNDTPFFGYQPEGKNQYRYYHLRPEVKLLTDLPEAKKESFIREKVGEVRFAGRRRYQISAGENEIFPEN